MESLDKLDTELYTNAFININPEKLQIEWSKIKNNKELLEEAIKIKKTKTKDRYTLNALTISYLMLVDYENVNDESYNKLTNIIYSNVDIARKVLGNTTFFSPNRISFLNLSLMNHELKLSKRQKIFAINEALLELRDHDGIEYQILSNPNWNEKEKKDVSYLFFKDDESYEEAMNFWEYDIINNINMKNPKDDELLLDEEDLLNFTYEDISKIYNGDEKKSKQVHRNIEFCKLMRKIRPKKFDFEEEKKVKEFNINKKVKVKLTDFGRYILGEKKYYENIESSEEGYVEFPLSELMYIFGSHMFKGNEEMFDKNIYIYEDDLKDKGNSRKLVK